VVASRKRYKPRRLASTSPLSTTSPSHFHLSTPQPNSTSTPPALPPNPRMKFALSLALLAPALAQLYLPDQDVTCYKVMDGAHDAHLECKPGHLDNAPPVRRPAAVLTGRSRRRRPRRARSSRSASGRATSRSAGRASRASGRVALAAGTWAAATGAAGAAGGACARARARLVKKWMNEVLLACVTA
jgi:hypothetical protein